MRNEADVLTRELGSGAGVYLVLLDVKEAVEPGVKTLPNVKLEPGLYGYVGSALGPGGVAKRVARHLKKEKRVRWHVDHLTVQSCVDVRAVIFSQTTRRAECCVSRNLSKSQGARAIRKFGSSDCSSGCLGHLIFLGKDLEKAVRHAEEAFIRCGLPPRRVSIPPILNKGGDQHHYEIPDEDGAQEAS